MATLVPNTNISLTTLLTSLINILNTNFQAVNTALGERLVGQRLSVNGYAATGSTTTKVTLGTISPPGSVPWAVLLVRAQESRNPASDLPVTTRVNFSTSGTADNLTVYVYEPTGLVANTQYDLSFLVIFT
jgi:hypothetical protein